MIDLLRNWTSMLEMKNPTIQMDHQFWSEIKSNHHLLEETCQMDAYIVSTGKRIVWKWKTKWINESCGNWRWEFCLSVLGSLKPVPGRWINKLKEQIIRSRNEPRSVIEKNTNTEESAGIIKKLLMPLNL